MKISPVLRRVAQYVIRIDTYYVLSIRIIHNTRDGQIWNTRGNIIIHFILIKKQLPARGELG